MKKLCILLCLVVSFLIGSSFFWNDKKTSEKIVHKTIKDVSVAVKKKYQLHLGGISEKGDKENDNKYELIGLKLFSNRYLSKDEARKIIVDISKIFLAKLNTDQVQPYLTVTPFGINNIEIDIIFSVYEKDVDYSYCSFCGLMRGEIYFWYDIPSEQYALRKDKNEPYAQALKLVEQQEKQTNIDQQQL